MAKYRVGASYTAEGARASRAPAGRAGATWWPRWRKVSGSLESFYFGFGNTDAYVVLDLPDNRSAAAASIAVSATGGAASEVVAFDAEEIDEASKLSVTYRPPGSHPGRPTVRGRATDIH